MEQLKELLARIPVAAILAVIAAYVGYDYYSFTTGELQQRKDQLQASIEENNGMQKKVESARKFYETLNQKRAELRGLAQQLEQMKASLSDQMDVPALMKLVVLEAARVGLTVQSIKPTESKTYDFYFEQAFDFEFKAVYPQLLVFLERIANLEMIIRLDKFEFKRTGSPTAKFVELGGVLQLKAYRYVTSKADEIGKTPSAGAPASTPPAGAGSGTKPPTGAQAKPGGGA